MNVREVGRELHLFQQLVLAARFEVVLEFEVAVEMIFNRALVPAGDDQDVVETGLHRSLAVVFVARWRAPHRHHGIADELLKRATVARDGRPRGLEVSTEDVADVLGI